MSRLRPTPEDLVDAAFAFALTALAVAGFRSSFGGDEAYLAGIPAALLGTAVGLAVAKVRCHLLVGAAVAVAGYFLFAGAVAFRGDALGGVLPSAPVVDDLVHGTVRGWVGLLTTVPPAGQAGTLLAVPYCAGYFGGLLAVTAALGFPRWSVCVLAPSVVLAVAVLFGTEEPASPLLQGGVFAASAVAWVSLRARRVDRALVAGGSRRLVRAGAMLGLIVLGAFAVGPALPGAGANERFILRDQIDPPFDPSAYPSPLARFREWHGSEVVLAADGETPIEVDDDPVLFTVEGLPEGEVVRFAVMDDYDGVVWRASPPGSAIGGQYRRVGTTIPDADDGDEATVRFEIGALASPDSVWIPTFGSTRSVTFEGPNADELSESFRFNRETETAATSQPLRPGDVWTVVATYGAELPGEAELAAIPGDERIRTDPLPGQDTVLPALQQAVDGLPADATPWQYGRRIADHLRSNGYYSDGDEARRVAPGHGIWRLEPFLTDPNPVGNGEQFAAGAAFALRALGVPARVVLEFEVDGDPASGPVAVRGRDAHATVEVALAGVGWVAIPEVTPPEDQPPPPPQEEQNTNRPEPQVQPPPPTTLPLPESDFEEEQQQAAVADSAEGTEGTGGILGTLLRLAAIGAIPVVVLAGPGLVVLSLKARRRRRRRTEGPPARRIANGWAEVLDLARDAGAPIPAKATRRELAGLLGVPSAALLATTADGHVFGAADPTDAAAEETWAQVEAVRGELLAPLSRLERLRAAVSLTSLRRER